jgi:hypothetical protein
VGVYLTRGEALYCTCSRSPRREGRAGSRQKLVSLGARDGRHAMSRVAERADGETARRKNNMEKSPKNGDTVV